MAEIWHFQIGINLFFLVHGAASAPTTGGSGAPTGDVLGESARA